MHGVFPRVYTLPTLVATPFEVAGGDVGQVWAESR